LYQVVTKHLYLSRQADHILHEASRSYWPEQVRVLEFQVCRRGRESRWVVMLGDAVYGAYLDKEQAVLDAVDAAREALHSGREAQVWLRDRSTPARVF
jgi:hypothetical protein